MSRSRWTGDWAPRTTPIRTADGIRAQSKRGAFASGWWAKRWIAVLEGFQVGTRLTRGRSYARNGQVTQIAIEPGGIRAQVQGSRPKPYDVTMRVRQLEQAEWCAVSAAIVDDVRLCAALLAGEMPEDIERAFSAAGTSLFPSSANEMKTACSCPDWSNPCKHLAAVFYLIGEEFDRDPLLLFVVRGCERDAVRDLFGPQAGADAPTLAASFKTIAERVRPVDADRTDGECADAKRAGEKSAGAERLPSSRRKAAPAVVSAQAFWGQHASVPPTVATRVEIGSTDEPAVLKRAGAFPFWRADIALADTVVPIYNDASAFALNWLAEHAQARKE